MMNKDSFIMQDVKKLGFKYLGNISFDRNLENSIGSPNKLIDTEFMKDLNIILERVNL